MTRSTADGRQPSWEADASAEISNGALGGICSLLMVWMLVYVDTQPGDQYIDDDETVVKTEDLKDMKVVRSHERVIAKAEIDYLKSRISEERQRADNAIRHAASLGVKDFSGGPSRVVVILDLAAPEAVRNSFERLIMQTDADRVVVVGCGDEIVSTNNDFVQATAPQRDSIVRKIANWPRSSNRRVLDAIDVANAALKGSRILLCLSGQPSGGTEAVVSYLREMGSGIPVNTIDYSTDPQVEEFLREVAKGTRGSYQRGR